MAPGKQWLRRQKAQDLRAEAKGGANESRGKLSRVGLRSCEGPFATNEGFIASWPVNLCIVCLFASRHRNGTWWTIASSTLARMA